MNCPACGHGVGDGARFCGGCGASLSAACPSCGGNNTPGNRFCQQCGIAIGAGSPPWGKDGERKQLTVLFADVVGFTPLSERFEPETVRELMDGCFAVLRSEIERFGGTVNTFTGDGCMALFGAPVTHEDHAARAVHAAWGVQQALAGYDDSVRRRWGVPFQVRLGLNTGLVVVGAIGDFEMTFTAIGDTVNLAARLQQAAPPGGIWVSEATWRAAGPEFAWNCIGPLEVKGKSVAVLAYEVAGLGSAQGRFEVAVQRGLTQFVGRDAELAQLVGAWERAEQGQGQVVSVVGEAGLGKSRLVHELKQHLSERGVPVFEGSCFAHGDITPYLPFLEVVRAAGNLDLKVAADARVFLDRLLGHPMEDVSFARLPAEVVRQRTVEALRDLILAEAAGWPVALIVEDVHWIDAASQEVLSALVEAMATASLLVVLVYRPEYLHAWADRAYHSEISLSRLGDASSAAMVRAILNKPYAAAISLERFSPEQSQTMLQHLLGTVAVPHELEALVAGRTDGNPLFVEELVRSLLESGDLVRRSDRFVFTRPVDELSVPASVQGVLIQRVDRLNPELRSVLQVASVLGRVFTYPLLRAITHANGSLDRQLLALEDLEFVYKTSLVPERAYSFKHVLTQEAVYETLVRSRRERYHERAGQAIETLYGDRLEEFYERVAYHYVRSANVEKAVEFLELANQKAARANSMAEAKTHFETAMRLLDRLPDTKENQQRRISLLVFNFDVFWMLYEPGEYLELLYHYEALANEHADLGLLGMFYKHVAHIQLIFGDGAGALKTIERAVKASEASGDVRAAGVGYAQCACTHFWLANYDEMVSWQTRALSAFEEQFDLRWYTYARRHVGWGYAQQGRWREAVDECNDALRSGYEYGDDSVVSFAAMILAFAYASSGATKRGIECGELAVEKAPSAAQQCFSQSFLGFALSRDGQPQPATELLASLVPLYDRARFELGWVFNGVHLGEAYWRAGRLDAARRTLETVTERAEHAGMRFFLGWAQRLLGEVTGEVDHFERSIAVLSEIGAENELALARTGYGRWFGSHGRLDEARRHLTWALEIFERLGTLGEPDRTREALRSFCA